MEHCELFCDGSACGSHVALRFLRDLCTRQVRQSARIHGRRAYRHWLLCARCHRGDLCVDCVRAGRAAVTACPVCHSSNWMRVGALERVLAGEDGGGGGSDEDGDNENS